MPEDFLSQLRRVNEERAIAWTGDTVVSALYWANEFAGEAGEVCNEVKKLERESYGWPGSRTTIDKLGDEIGDVLISLDGLARFYGIDLAEVTARKFNATSDKVGFPHKLEV